MTDKILLSGAHFFAHHGVSDEEQRLGGRYVVDVELHCDLARSAAGDSLADTISYADVYRCWQTILQKQSWCE